MSHKIITLILNDSSEIELLNDGTNQLWILNPEYFGDEDIVKEVEAKLPNYEVVEELSSWSQVYY